MDAVVTGLADWGYVDGKTAAILQSGGNVLGLLLLADKLGGAFEAPDLAKARTVADFAGVALRNAKRFSELERGGLGIARAPPTTSPTSSTTPARSSTRRTATAASSR